MDSDSGEEHEQDAKEPALKSDREALKLERFSIAFTANARLKFSL